MKNVFNQEDSAVILNRIDQLTENSQPQWGKMSIGQMLAHCNVTYELVYEEKHKKPGFLMKLILKAFVKNTVINETPYPKNSRTGPQFLITDTRIFEKEKQRLIDYITKTQQLGAAQFEGKASHSFGPLTGQEWNNMFYKHLDHHLRQFGV